MIAPPSSVLGRIGSLKTIQPMPAAQSRSTNLTDCVAEMSAEAKDRVRQ